MRKMTQIKPGDRYPAFEKIPRLHREITITEKIDGTNGLIAIEQKFFGESAGWTMYGQPNEHPSDVVASVLRDSDPPGDDGLPDHEYWVRAGSRTRWLREGEPDNAGFRVWVRDNARTLVKDLGPGLHFGEWYGQGINRRYGLDHKRFALFNTKRWTYETVLQFRTPNLEVVPILWDGPAQVMSHAVDECLKELRENGSVNAPGFMRPEGIVVFHSAAGQYFKVTLEKDEKPKAIAKAT
jgi:hypothetical protein